MIVVSGVLVVVAIVLLVFGVFVDGDTGVRLIYLCIGLSLTAGGLLAIGAYQRRGEQFDETDETDETDVSSRAPAGRSAAVPASVPAGSRQPAPVPAGAGAALASARAPASATATAPSPVPGFEEYDDSLHDEDFEDEDEDFPPGTVFVVEGRPRYHVEGCRYLAGRDVEAVDVGIAQDEGFTACGVCRPDQILAAEQDGEPVQPEYESVPVPDTEPEPAAPARGPEPARRPEPAVAVATLASSASSASSASGSAVGSRRRGAAPTPAPAPAPATADVTPPGLPRVVVPPVATVPREAGPSAAARRNRVVVLPDRGKFHQPDCRFVRHVTGGQQLTKAAATKQGYTPCGVCRP